MYTKTMAASIPESEFFTTVRDPIYSVSQKPVAVDSDTIRKSTRIIPASADGSASTLAGSLNGRRTVFNFSNGTNQRMRWDTTVLEVDLQWSTAAGGFAASAVNCAPSWNLFGRLVDAIKLNFNGSGVEIYNKSGGYYLPDFTARMMRYYNLEQLNKKDDCLFTPIDDYEYLWARADSEKYDNNGDNMQSSTDPDEYVKFDHAQIGAVGVCEIAVAEPCTFTNKRLTTNLTSAKLRYFRYIADDDIAGTNRERVHTLRVPFIDLFPRFQGILKNLRSVQLEIVWTAQKEILEYIGSDGDGAVHVMNARIVTDDYVMSSGQTMENLSDKMQGEADNISFLDPVVHRRQWTGNDLIITAQRNVDSVMLFQIASQCSLDTAADVYARSHGQFFLFNSEADAAAHYRVSSAGAAVLANSWKIPPASIQLIYGDIQYPQSPLDIVKTATDGGSAGLNVAGMYNEFLKMQGKAGDRLNGYPITTALMGRTMPFISLKPFANDAIKLSDSKDIILRMPSAGTTPAREVNKNCWVILFELASFKINVDGTVLSQVSAR
jgi:hypothetical protein